MLVNPYGRGRASGAFEALKKVGADYAGVASQLAENAKQLTPFAHNADIGLRRWRAALAKVKAGANQIANLVVLGDSISEGTGSDANRQNWITTGYVGKIRSALAAKYGDAGRGFLPIYYPTGSPFWVFSGTWTAITQYGVMTQSKGTSENGATATLTFSGVGIDIMVVGGSASIMGTFTCTIDGGEPTTLTGGGVSGNSVILSISGLSDGSHTMVLTKSDDGKLLYLSGACEIKTGAGIRVHNCAKSGAVISTAANVNSMLAAITKLTPALTIIAFTANDYTSQTSIASYKASLQAIITEALKTGDCLCVSNGLRQESMTIVQSDYVAAMKEIALLNNVAYIDAFNRWGANYAYANTMLGFMADTVHPNLYGHQDLATGILRIIDEY